MQSLQSCVAVAALFQTLHSATKPEYVLDSSDVNRSSKKPVSDVYTSVQFADPPIVTVQFSDNPERLANSIRGEQSADAQLLTVTKS